MAKSCNQIAAQSRLSLQFPLLVCHRRVDDTHKFLLSGTISKENSQ